MLSVVAVHIAAQSVIAAHRALRCCTFSRSLRLTAAHCGLFALPWPVTADCGVLSLTVRCCAVLRLIASHGALLRVRGVPGCRRRGPRRRAAACRPPRPPAGTASARSGSACAGSAVNILDLLSIFSVQQLPAQRRPDRVRPARGNQETSFQPSDSRFDSSEPGRVRRARAIARAREGVRVCAWWGACERASVRTRART